MIRYMRLPSYREFCSPTSFDSFILICPSCPAMYSNAAATRYPAETWRVVAPRMLAGTKVLKQSAPNVHDSEHRSFSIAPPCRGQSTEVPQNAPVQHSTHSFITVPESAPGPQFQMNINRQ